MTITFIPQNRFRQYLLLLLAGLALLGGVFFAWYRFFREAPPLFFAPQPPPPVQIEIDWTVFEHPAFLELQEPMLSIPVPPVEEVGKKNPFLI